MNRIFETSNFVNLMLQGDPQVINDKLAQQLADALKCASNSDFTDAWEDLAQDYREATATAGSAYTDAIQDIGEQYDCAIETAKRVYDAAMAQITGIYREDLRIAGDYTDVSAARNASSAAYKQKQSAELAAYQEKLSAEKAAYQLKVAGEKEAYSSKETTLSELAAGYKTDQEKLIQQYSK